MDIAEIPLDILEKPKELVEKEGDIEEIPKQIELIQEETIEKPSEILENTEPPKAKRGRPPGSKNKAPAKPRKTKIAEMMIEEDVSPKGIGSYEPSSPKTIMAAKDSSEGVNDIAVEVLRLLRSQAGDRQRKKRVQYASWFR